MGASVVGRDPDGSRGASHRWLIAYPAGLPAQQDAGAATEAAAKQFVAITPLAPDRLLSPVRPIERQHPLSFDHRLRPRGCPNTRIKAGPRAAEAVLVMWAL